MANVKVSALGSASALTGTELFLTTQSGASVATTANQIGAFVLPTTGVTAGSYSNANITVDSRGRVTSAANGSAGGGAGTVTSVSVTTANGVSGSVANASTTPAISLTLGAITPSSVAATGAVTGSNLSGTNTGDQTSVSGNAGTATKLATGRTIAITGDLAYTSPTFDGSGNITAAGTLATVNSNTGSFGSASAVPVLTVNGKGLITAVSTAALGTAAAANTGTSGATLGFLNGANTVSGTETHTAPLLTAASVAGAAGLNVPAGTAPTTPNAGDIWGTTAGLFDYRNGTTNTLAYLTSNVASASKWLTARTLSFTGDTTGSLSVDGSANASTALTLAASGVTAGTYGSATAVPVPTIDAKGRITSITTAALGAAAAQTYVEGAFTPAVAFGGSSTGVTYSSTPIGRYTRIGRIVIVDIQINMSSKGSATGNTSITGLPFASNSVTTTGTGGFMATLSTGGGTPFTFILPSSTSIALYNVSGGGFATLTDANFNNNTQMYITLTYSL